MLIHHRSSLRLCALSLLAFALLAVRFSPNWLEYWRELDAAQAQAADAAHRAVVTHGFENAVCTARGTQVTRQVTDLGAPIEDPNHKIVRWRLLFPALGYFLGLPATIILGLGAVGGVLFVSTLCVLGYKATGSLLEGFSLSVVTGATAPFFASFGWLGYYDVWLALALVAVAYVRARSWVLLTCLLAPWADERVVLGLPLALCVRWTYFEVASSNFKTWFLREAALPIVLIGAFACVRLSLGGTGGSQTIRGYIDEFVFARDFAPARMLHGAWEGLRVGWILVFFTAIEGIRTIQTERSRSVRLLLVSLMAASSLAVGLLSALDISRSMVLVLPAVPLGWILASRTVWWKNLRLAPILASAALLIPAHHVVSRFVMPVDNLWSPPFGAAEALNRIGVAYWTGTGVPQNDSEAAKWFRQAAERGAPAGLSNLGILYQFGRGVPKNTAEALRLYHLAVQKRDGVGQCNLGFMYFTGDGVPTDANEAAKWFRLAAQQGVIPAQSNLGTMYLQGYGVPQDAAEAVKWYRRAAIQGDGNAQAALGVMYTLGDGVPKDVTTAIKWHKKAAFNGHAGAQSNLGVMYAKGDGVPRDEMEALAWFYLASEGGDAAAAQFLERAENGLDIEMKAKARNRRRELLHLIQNNRD